VKSLVATFALGSLTFVVSSPAFAQTPPPAAPPPAGPPAVAAPPPAAPPPAAPPPAAEPPPAAPTPIVVAPAAPPEGAEAEPPPPPKKLEVGSAEGFWQPSALLQFWLYGAQEEMTPAGGPEEDDKKTINFRLRRAELKVKGEILPKTIGYQFMIDPARALEVSNREVPVEDGEGSVTVAQPPTDASGNPNALTILQDFFITFQSDYVDFSVGQFKIPLSMEGYASSSKILFPERAPAARRWGDRRDIGLRFEKKLGDYFGYSAGLFNGTGQNKPDDDRDKDGALRLEVYPIEGLTLAGVGYTTIGTRDDSFRDRLEGDIKYDANDFYVIGEYFLAWDSRNQAKATQGHGSYIEAAYTLFGKLQPMVRFGEVEPNKEKKGDYYRHYDFGVNYLIQKAEAKVGLAVSYYDPENPTPPTNTKKLEGTLAAQVSF
jgi:hypothetical protein